MPKNPSQHTSYTLLERALDLGDDSAWQTLDQQYRQYIYYLLHRLEVASDEIEEYTQLVMVGLTSKLKNYDNTKGKFRAWLHVVVRNEVIENYRKAQARARLMERYTQALRDDKDAATFELDTLITEEWETYLINKALEKLKEMVSEKAIRVFELTREGCSVQEITEALSITTDSVYTIRMRIKKQLVEEVRELRSQLENE